MLRRERDKAVPFLFSPFPPRKQKTTGPSVWRGCVFEKILKDRAPFVFGYAAAWMGFENWGARKAEQVVVVVLCEK